MTTAQEVVAGLAYSVSMWLIVGYLWTHGVSWQRGLSILAGTVAWLLLWSWWVVAR